MIAHIGRLILSHGRAWLPPVIVMIVIFLALIFLSHGRTVLPFLYRHS